MAEVYINRAILNLSLRKMKEAIADCKKAESLGFKEKDLYLVRGTAYKEMEEYRKAIQNFDHILISESENIDALINRGLALLALKSMDSALVDFEKVLEIDSNNTLGYFYRGNWYLQNEENKKALADFNRSILISNRNSAVYFNRAIAKSRMKDYKEAIKDFNQVLKLSPDNITALYNRAGLKFQLNKLQEALKDYDRAIALYPKYADAYYNRSLVKKQLRRIDEAEKDHKIAVYLQKSGESFSENAGLYEAGQLLKLTELKNDFRLDEKKASKPQYRFSDIKFSPILIWQLNGLEGNKYFAYESKAGSKSGDYRLILQNDSMDSPGHTGKISQLDSVLKQEPQNAQLYFEKGVWLGHASSYAEAFEAFERALRFRPNEFKTLFARANTRLQLARQLYISLPADNFMAYDQEVEDRKNALEKHYQMIIADYDKVLELNPDFYFARYNRAYAKALQEDYQGAFNDLTECLKSNKRLAEGFYNRGLINLLFLDNSLGCGDLSRAGELGMSEVYSIIKRYCN